MYGFLSIYSIAKNFIDAKMIVFLLRISPHISPPEYCLAGEPREPLVSFVRYLCAPKMDEIVERYHYYEVHA